MSKNKYFPKVKLFGKKQIERWAGAHFLCIDARLHLLYCISWPNYYTLLHTEMQNADKMHLFCCHSQQPDSCKSCDFHFITIRSLAHGFGNARFLAERIFRHLQVARLLQKLHWLGFYHQLEHLQLLHFVTTILVIALSLWNIFSMISFGIIFDINLIQDKDGNLRRKELLTWLDQVFISADGHINRKSRDKITYCEDHWNSKTSYGILQF